MTETLLTASSIKMYGRKLTDLKYTDDAFVIGNNNFLQRQLAGGTSISGIATTVVSGAGYSTTVSTNSTLGLEANMPVTAAGVFAAGTTIVNPIVRDTSFTVSTPPQAAVPNFGFTGVVQVNFARIYAFSFEGAIYSLPKPSIFVVHGPGTPIVFNKSDSSRTTMEMSGVAAREWEFSESPKAAVDLSYWEYEKGDFSLRLDTEAGPLEQILLAAALRGADMADRSGANLGIRSGANLSGANVSGANVSGANLSGANLSGANLRNR